MPVWQGRQSNAVSASVRFSDSQPRLNAVDPCQHVCSALGTTCELERQSMDRELVLIVALNPGVGAIAHVEMNSAFRRTAKPVFLFGFIVFQVI